MNLIGRMQLSPQQEWRLHNVHPLQTVSPFGFQPMIWRCCWTRACHSMWSCGMYIDIDTCFAKWVNFKWYQNTKPVKFSWRVTTEPDRIHFGADILFSLSLYLICIALFIALFFIYCSCFFFVFGVLQAQCGIGANENITFGRSHWTHCHWSGIGWSDTEQSESRVWHQCGGIESWPLWNHSECNASQFTWVSRYMLLV